jgi:hypothetical protein
MSSLAVEILEQKLIMLQELKRPNGRANQVRLAITAVIQYEKLIEQTEDEQVKEMYREKIRNILGARF